MSREKFYIDCDEVLRQTLDSMLDVYNKNFASGKTRDDVKSFVVDESFPEIQEQTGMTASHWFFQEHSKEIFEDTEPFPYIAEDIKKLREYGDVIIVTHQKSLLNKIQTLEWLDKHNIEYDGICLIKHKEEVISGGFMLDDNDWNFQNAEAKCGVLIDAPYNKDVDLKEIAPYCCTMVRCASVHDFVEKYVALRKNLEEAEYKYLGKKFTLKESVPYMSKSLLSEKKTTFGEEGDNIVVEDVYEYGLDVLVYFKFIDSWGGISINANNADKYFGEYKNIDDDEEI